jgi:hypothetical protein
LAASWAAAFVFFAVFFAALFAFVDETGATDSLVAPPEDCPATGNTMISMKSRPARQRKACRGMEVVKRAPVISPL